ncbi:hypothetical protein SAMN05428960_1129 [Mitsuaria sp. PDC51]|jgi:hypothetical protein|uniref:Tse2 family ADP-ribosyltransferase toxin n=1 Tax=unclassified Roseateles TaxID=2626991 RepID=UPI0008E6E97F|nr:MULTISPECIES: hypothetical protein [unclassified Roseateles]MBB3292480.1 hypothetical protein [Mitsuaria sp. BK041]MBB3361697.1 hypothetical protein [Mitsuaria sp. BK045]SFR75418.1 hypothetical protein SAMN05428960_1129 [Mitsuaria sp. PDC51]
MSVTTLKDVLRSLGEDHNYFDGKVPVNLWRGLHAKKGGGLFDLIEEVVVYSAGRLRPPDIDIVNRGGSKWVTVARSPRGISTFDKAGVPSGKDWSYYRISAGTVLPNGLAIVKDNFNPRLGATHYTIAPAHDMPLEQFKMLLNQLAVNAIKEAA